MLHDLIAAVLWYASHPLAPGTAANYALVVLAASYVSWVIVYSGVNKPNRYMLLNLSMKDNAIGKVAAKLYDMTQCPFCTGMWVSTGIQMVFRFDFFGAGALGVLLGIPAIAAVQSAVALSLGLLVKKNPCDSCVQASSTTTQDEEDDDPAAYTIEAVSA